MHFLYSKEPVIERDPAINKLRADVFNTLESIIKEAFPDQPPLQPTTEIRFVSYEEALRELAQMQKNKFV